MKIRLLDFEGTPKWVNIPDGKDASGVVLSGDMVMTSPINADASKSRLADFYDGPWHLRADQIEEWNKFGERPYAIFDFLDQEGADFSNNKDHKRK